MTFHVKQVENITEAWPQFDYTDDNKGSMLLVCRLCRNKPESTGKFVVHSDGFLKISKHDSTEEKEIKRAKNKSFSNLKIAIHKHLTKCQPNEKEQEEMKKMLSREKVIGLRVARWAYTIFKNALPHEQFESLLLTSDLNGTDIGNINHSRFFVPKFLSNLYIELQGRFKSFFGTPIQATKERPPVAISADLATHRGSCRNFVTAVTINPGSDVLIKAIPLGAVSVGSQGRGGREVAEDVVQLLATFDISKAQVVSTVADGALVREQLGQHIEKLLQTEHDVIHSYDAMHKINRVEVKVLANFQFIDDTRDKVSSVNKFFHYGKQQAKLQETATAKNITLHSTLNFSVTRMANHTALVLKNFIRNFPALVDALRGVMQDNAAATSTQKKEIHDKASSLLNRILNKKFVILLAGT